MKIHLNWSYKATTIVVGKLLQTWEQEGIAMAHRVVYRMKVYNIPMCLVVNIYQTRVHHWRRSNMRKQEGLNMFKFWEFKTKDKLLLLFFLQQKGHCYIYKLCFKGQQIALPTMNHGRKQIFQSVSILPTILIIGPIWKPLKHLLNTSSYLTRRIKWRSLLY
jgi:hypothetical protein